MQTAPLEANAIGRCSSSAYLLWCADALEWSTAVPRTRASHTAESSHRNATLKSPRPSDFLFQLETLRWSCIVQSEVWHLQATLLCWAPNQWRTGGGQPLGQIQTEHGDNGLCSNASPLLLPFPKSRVLGRFRGAQWLHSNVVMCRCKSHQSGAAETPDPQPR